MKKQRTIIIDGNFIITTVLVIMLALNYLQYVELDWGKIGFLVVHTVTLLGIIRIIFKSMKVFINKIKYRKGGSNN